MEMDRERLAATTGVVLGILSLNPGNAVADPGDRFLSPRAYCASSDGTVIETEDTDTYICCYLTKDECIASNTALGLSTVIHRRPDSIAGHWSGQQSDESNPL